MNLPSSALSSLGSTRWWGVFFWRRPRFGKFCFQKCNKEDVFFWLILVPFRCFFFCRVCFFWNDRFDWTFCRLHRLFLKSMLDHFANAITHLWNTGTTWEKFAPPKNVQQDAFFPLGEKNLRCFSAFLRNMFSLKKIFFSKHCWSLTAWKPPSVSLSVRFHRFWGVVSLALKESLRYW